MGTTECEKYRTISIISQMGKIIGVLRNRLKRKVEENVAKEQFGFRKGMGTSNAIFCLRNIIERAVEMQKDVYMCFVDYEKAFDTVRHEELVRIIKETGVDGKDIRLIANLYWNEKAAVKVGEMKSEWVNIRRGVRQGCVLSPDISLYGQKCMESLIELEGVRIGGRNVTNTRYADDTVLLADSEEKLQRLVDEVQEASEERGLKINIKKTEVLGITKAQCKDIYW